jgi:hypothetical protein
MLDYEVATSFSGWFYGWYFPRLKNEKAKKRLVKIMKRVHADDEFLSLEDVPFLEPFFEEHDHFETWLYWVRRCYSPKSRKNFEEVLENCAGTAAYKFESVSRFNFHFNKFDDPKTWFQLPKTSIILMDEAQQYFPPRGVNSRNPVVPDHIGKFETHRHDGFDVHIITQDPKLIDVNVRRLVGRHVHFYNPTGGERVTRYQNPKAFDPDQWHDKQACEKSLIRREKAFYGVYWSAEIHTHKFKVPKFVWYFLGLLVFLGFMFYLISGLLLSDPEAEQAPVPEQNLPEVQRPAAPSEQKSVVEPESPQDQIKSLAQHFSGLLEDVYIDGHVKTILDSGARVYYDYTFSNSVTGDVFYPDRLGMVVQPVSSCLVVVRLADVTRAITCNPFYKRGDHVEQVESLEDAEAVDLVSIGF